MLVMGGGGARAVDRLLTVALLGALLVAIATGLGPNTSTRVVGLGEAIWPGYGADLRVDPEVPTCDREGLAARQATCSPAPAPAPGGDPFAEADPFADPPAPAPGGDPFAAADPFADPPAPAAAADPFAEADPFAAPPAAADAPNCAALAALADRCEARWVHHQDVLTRITPAVRAWRALDRPVAAVAAFPFKEHLLVVVLLLGALSATLHRAHLALREAASPFEHRVAQGAQLIAHLSWFASSWAFWGVQASSSAEAENAALAPLWTLGFAALSLVNLAHLVRPPAFTGPPPLRARSLLVIPLYTWMVAVAAAWYLLVEGHPSGQSILLARLTAVPSVYMGVALYIWAGMLLARTTVAARVFDLLTPWGLPPAWLAWLVVVLSALPTAYSGASGIFVIAAGAVIFERLRAEGASERLALGATAMSGSLGVVLRPCLVVVLVSILNPDVTTDELFGWGKAVFALTAGLYLVAMLWRNDQALRRPDLSVALGATSRAALALLPYVALVAGSLVGVWALAGTVLDEHSGALVLPGVMLVLAAWDRSRSRDAAHPDAFGPAVARATGAASHHVGALLVLMAASVAFGGVLERSELLEALPDELGSRWLAMAFLVVVLVLVGMVMDALGAVILVSTTLAHVAAANGIHPAHFWMMVLCAFELGYLTPPVALNHLLARQVIGAEAEVERLPAGSLWERHEHVLLPVVVMGTALLLVAFVPLAFV